MHCFYHPETEAVAICKCCGRGICPACARSSPTAVACSEACSAELAATRALVSRSRSSFGTTASAYRAISTVLGLLAILIFALGFSPLFNMARTVLWILAAICLFGAWSTFRIGRQLAEPK